jgi:hypothetical protein
VGGKRRRLLVRLIFARRIRPSEDYPKYYGTGNSKRYGCQHRKSKDIETGCERLHSSASLTTKLVKRGSSTFVGSFPRRTIRTSTIPVSREKRRQLCRFQKNNLDTFPDWLRFPLLSVDGCQMTINPNSRRISSGLQGRGSHDHGKGTRFWNEGPDV